MLQSTIQKIDSEIELYVKEATRILNEYNDWWFPIRDTQRQIREPGMTYLKSELGALQPVLRFRKNIGKYYIVWVNHSHYQTKRINKKWAKEITPTQKGYTEKQLARLAHSWEVDKVIEIENQLKPVRAAINTLHKAKVSFNKLESKSNDGN